MVVVADIDRFIAKGILVDNGNHCNVLTWVAAKALQINLERSKKIGTFL